MVSELPTEQERDTIARRGSFTKAGVDYGIPLSFVHPQDNKMPGPFIPELQNAALSLTLTQQQDLQDRIDDLYQTLKGERNYLSQPFV